MKTLNIKGTIVFQKNWDALNGSARFIVNEGGSRSSKTYSLCQCVVLWSLNNPERVVSIIRKTSPALRASVLRDFLEVLRDLDLYDDEAFRKVDGTYTFPNGTMVEFFAADDEQKLRGRKRDIAWINEPNELSYEDFQQVALRTTEKIIVDYNPSAIESYLYHLPEEKTVTIHSTYRDNPFLNKETREQIESYLNSDPDYYQIFALGKRCFSKENVFPEWPQEERPAHLEDWVYAIDFGYQHPTALVKIWYSPSVREIHVEELIYESFLTSTQIVDRMVELELDPRVPIISETARPEIVQDIRNAGYLVINADKNVQDGIMTMKSFRISVEPTSENIIKENYNYRYQKHNGQVTELPVKLWDDAIDAIRYGAMYIKRHKLRERGVNRREIWNFEL